MPARSRGTLRVNGPWGRTALGSLSTVVFVLLYCGGVIVALLVDGAFGVYLYEVEYFLNSANRWWTAGLPSLRYTLIIALVTLVAYVIRSKKYSANRFLEARPVRWWIALTLLLVAITPIAVWPAQQERITQYALKYLVMGYLIYKLIDTPVKFERLIWAYLAGEFYLAWLVSSVGRNESGRVEGIGPSDAQNANDMAAVLVTCVPLLIYYLLSGKRWQQVLALICLAFVLNALILINSRGAFLATVGGVMFFAYFILWKEKLSARLRLRFLACGILSVALFVWLTDALFWERMATLLGVEVGEGQLTGAAGGASRTIFWMLALDVVRDNPLGTGAYGFNYLSPQIVPPEHLGRGAMRAIHSTWFQTLAELGYLGLVILLALIASVFRWMGRARRHLRDNGQPQLAAQCAAICGGYFAFLIAATFIDRLWAETFYWFVAFSACFVNIYLLKGNIAQAPANIPRRMPRNMGPTFAPRDRQVTEPASDQVTRKVSPMKSAVDRPAKP